MNNLKTRAPFWVLIPARMGSTRFPGKMLACLEGQTVLERTFRQASMSDASEVVVVTDHPQIEEVAQSFGARVLMTDPTLPSGTDRCAAGLWQIDKQPLRMVNVQGDEPFINPNHINQVASMLADGAPIATLGIPITQNEVLTNPNIVKIVLGVGGKALLFSRHPIPYARATGGVADVTVYPYVRHLGIYGFQTSILHELVALKPSALELTESLEQLRWLENGYPIQVALVDEAGPGIDTPNDLSAAEAWLKTHG